MSERIRGSYDDALYKSTYTLLYFTIIIIIIIIIRLLVLEQPYESYLCQQQSSFEAVNKWLSVPENMAHCRYKTGFPV